MFNLVALKENVRLARILWIIKEVCSNQGFLAGLWKNCQKQKPRRNLMPKRCLHGPVTWNVMQRNAWKDIANWRIKQRNNYAKSRRHGWMTTSSKKKMDQLDNSPQFAHKLFWNIYIWHVLVDLIFYGLRTKLARAVTKWIRACDKRLARLISYIHHTSEFRQYCYVGNTAKQCRKGLLKDSDFAGDLEDSKSTSGGILCIFGSHTFVPISCMCKKQTSVSHRSPET